MERLTDPEIRKFINDGFVKIEGAFPRALADEARAILWRDIPCDPADPSTWKEPVVRLGYYRDAPFLQAANTRRLHQAFDQLVGTGQWLPRNDLGTFPVRFPAAGASDTGWHVDASIPDAENSFHSWRINFRSTGRALLMLFLFSDTGNEDAPTRLRIGSHIDVARILFPSGDRGLSFMELAERLDVTSQCSEVRATGEAGTVYLCHPFIVHAAQPHRGSTPRFLAQPPLHPAKPFRLDRDHGTYSPVEAAIIMGMQKPER